MELKLLQLQLHYHWVRVMHLRNKGRRRMARGAGLSDTALQRWSGQITARGLKIHRLQQRYLRACVDKQQG